MFASAGQHHSPNFHLVSTGQAVNSGTTLNSAVLPANNVTLQYLKHQSNEARPVNAALDLGAYEFAPAAPMQILTSSLPVRYAFVIMSRRSRPTAVRAVSFGRLH